MSIELLHVYGPYFSSVYGNVVLVDPLMPPKKCPLDCISCPLGATRIFNRELTLRLNTTRIIGELSEAYSAFSRSSLNLSAIYVWGSGDPLTLSSIISVLEAIYNFTCEAGRENRILVHASIVNMDKVVKYSREIEKYVDRVIVPFLWYGEDRIFLGWNQEYSFSRQLEVFRNATTLLKDKITVELHVFKIKNSLYPDTAQLAETTAYLRNLNIEELIVKCVDRPSTSQAVKSVPRSYIEKIKEELTSTGFKVSIEELSAPAKVVVWRNTIIALYNYLIRIPLKYGEIASIYGPLGVEALNNLVAKKLVVKEPWSGSIYYRGVVI